MVASGAVECLGRCVVGGTPDAAAHAAEALLQLAAADSAQRRTIVERSGVVEALVAMLGSHKASARSWSAHLLRMLSMDRLALWHIASAPGLVAAVGGLLAAAPSEEQPAWLGRRAKVQAVWLLARLCSHPASAHQVLASAGLVRTLVVMLRDGQMEQWDASSPAQAAAATPPPQGGGQQPPKATGPAAKSGGSKGGSSLPPSRASSPSAAPSSSSAQRAGSAAAGGGGGMLTVTGHTSPMRALDYNPVAASTAALLALAAYGREGRQAVLTELALQEWSGRRLSLAGLYAPFES